VNSELVSGAASKSPFELESALLQRALIPALLTLVRCFLSMLRLDFSIAGELRAGVGLCLQEPLLKLQLLKLRRRAHTADSEGFVRSDFRTLRDQICAMKLISCGKLTFAGELRAGVGLCLQSLSLFWRCGVGPARRTLRISLVWIFERYVTKLAPHRALMLIS